ncbi:MAG: phage tail protein, partial [Kiritimatiellia bacterium]
AFTLTAYAIGATGYQWFRDGESVPGATSAWCEIEPIRAGTHRYQVAATLADGTTALSEVATVTVFNRSTVITIR